MSSPSVRDVRAWLEARAEELTGEEVASYSAPIVEAIATAVPEVACDEELLAAVTRNAEESSRLGLRVVLPGAGPAESTLPAGAQEIAHGLVRRGYDVSVLLKIYRVALSAAWLRLMQDVTDRVADPAMRAAVLDRSWRRLSSWLETQVERLAQRYEQERRVWLYDDLARRTETVTAILAGEPVDSEAASVTLGHDIHRMHTAVVLWSDDDDARAELADAGAPVAAALNASRALSLPVGSAALWLWVTTDRAPAASALVERPVLAELPGVRAAVGLSARGIEGFRSSHEEAQLARRVADRDTQIVLYRDVEIAALMSGEPDGVRRLVARELGALAADDSTISELRETLRVFLALNANTRQAAAALHLHRNTVLYRLRRVEELIGYPVADRRPSLEVALNLAHTLGERVLSERSAVLSDMLQGS